MHANTLVAVESDHKVGAEAFCLANNNKKLTSVSYKRVEGKHRTC
jgi:hypothetical protein